MRIALIGPAYPYRGGIAHHTNMLATYLRKHGHTVDIITFTRQYPKILYPGKSQEEAGDAGETASSIVSERMIDSINPWTWVRTGRILRKGNYDLYVLRFWMTFFGFCFGTIARMVRNPRKRNVLVILDNLIPHESRPGDTFLTRFFLRQCSMAIAQSSIVQKQVKEMFPDIPNTLLPHPVYENFGQLLEKAEARKALGIPEGRILLFFGFVRQYKGLDTLLAAMPEIVRRMPGARLLVVGEFFDGEEAYRRQISEGRVEDKVMIFNQYVPNEEVARWFSAADVLVLPYHSATNSGIVQIGYNFATPSIVTNVGSLAEVVINGETGYVLDDASPNSLASAVERIYEADTLQRFAENIVEERKKYSWDAFVEGMITFVETQQSS